MFRRDFDRYDGVRPINVLLLRIVFGLTFTFVGLASWSTILNHSGEWKPLNAVAWSVWSAYSALAIFGILKPLKMLPVMVFQIFYKLIFLTIVSFPLWLNDRLVGSEAENITNDFLWVALPMVAMPWKYFFRRLFAREARPSNVPPYPSGRVL